MGTDTYFGSARTLYVKESSSLTDEDEDAFGSPEHTSTLHGLSFFNEIALELRTLVKRGGTRMIFGETVIPASSMSRKGQISQSLGTIEFEIFKITEMARRWIVENGLSPYKLALTADTSPSQVHKIMEPGWSPSLKLARKIASSLPEEWVSSFERECNACLPRLFYMQPSSATKSGPINEVVQAINSKPTGDALDILLRNGFGCRRFQFNSRSEIAVITAQQSDGQVGGASYAPPSPRLTWNSGNGDEEQRNAAYAIHRVPLQTGEDMALCTVHIAEFDGHNWAMQFWKVEESKILSSTRQLGIISAYMAEFPLP